MARHLARWELDGVRGPVVVVDVIRAFTTAAYAFGSGAAEIDLVGDVEEALAFKEVHPGTITLGEDRGLRPEGFDHPNDAGLGEPTYVITGRFEDAPDTTGDDDVLAADLIERARLGQPLDAAAASAASLATDEAARTLALGPGHSDQADIELAAAVDAFDFAMEVERTPLGLRLTPRRVR